MLNFEPKTEEELSNLIPANTVCRYQVINAEDKTSKTGNQMIKLDMKIWDPTGGEHSITDYLLGGYKLKHFCDSNGLTANYNAGRLSAIDCKNRKGFLIVLIDKDPSGLYRDSNKVKDYLASAAGGMPGFTQASVHAGISDLDDDVPFL